MKKFVIILIAALILGSPALIIHFSMQTLSVSMQQEHEKQLVMRLQNDLQAQNQVTNPIFEISQHFSIFLARTANILFSDDDPEAIEKVKKRICEFFEQLPNTLGFLCQTSIEYQQTGQVKKISYENGHKVSGNLLEKLTTAMRDVQIQCSNRLPANEAIKNLADLMKNEFPLFYNLYYLDGQKSSTEVNRIILREPESVKLLITLSGGCRFLLNSLIDFTKVDERFLAKRQVAKWKNKNSGLILFKNGEKNSPVCSSFFSSRQKLLLSIVNTIASASDHTTMLKVGNYLVLITPPDPKRPYRLAITAPLPIPEPQPRMNLLLSFFAIAGCAFVKLVTEKVIFNRGSGISLKAFIILTFIIVTMLPLLSSFYLTNEYVVSNFKLQKNQVAESLSSDLLDMDLATFSAFRDSINRVKGLNSVESLAAFTGLPESSPTEKIVNATMNKLWEVNKKPLFSEIWIFSNDKNIGGIEFLESQNIYCPQKSENVFINEIFEPRFRKFFSNYQKKQALQQNDKEEIKFDEVKGEILDSIILNLFGEKTYYRMRENFDSIIKLESCFDSNSIISVPVTYKGKLQYILTWILSSSEIRRHFPEEQLNVESGKPINFIVFGNDRIFRPVPNNLNLLTEKFPELIALARQSHLTTTRLVMHDLVASGSPVLETRPARYSDYILCGQRETRSLESISNELADKALGFFFLMALTGLLFALLTSLYFTIPIRQLTEATREIIDGRFSVRLSESHPDEFALSAIAFNKMATALTEGQLLRHFVSDSVKKMAKNVADGGSERVGIVDATILFSSIKNFHELQHQLDPEKIFAIMQAHLSAAVEFATTVGGEIDKMIEDKVMIVFNHKTADHKGPALAALQTAAYINKILKTTHNLDTAAGINSGEVVSGVMGAANVRLAKTVVGDTVNLAARLASVASDLPAGGIVISGVTAQQAGDSFIYQKLPINNVKGKTHTVEAYLAQEIS